ncbi:MAG: ATP phosphoribosyltransferase regulatory subunit, partial [Chloroflexota bacterium]|nr:ATP phosphoribosyltransferase regulatory subunit [Chloroflexota bacterium]
IAYYTGVVFEVEHDGVTGAPPLGGGGRYDGLVKALGGSQDIPALGFALSLERVSELLPDDFDDGDAPSAGRVLVTAQETAVGQAVATAERLRAQGIPAELDLSHDGDAAAAAYAKRRGIETIMRVGRDGSVDERPA